MPDLQDPAILAARRNRLEAAMSRGGRASTMLAGGDEYNNNRLGIR